VSVVSGGLACIAGALLVARLLPGFRHQRAVVADAETVELPGTPGVPGTSGVPGTADAAGIAGPASDAVG
jgi:hypothetical protein